VYADGAVSIDMDHLPLRVPVDERGSIAAEIA
jgi:hypothetical protein